MGVTDQTLMNELVGEIGLSPYGTFFALKSMDCSRQCNIIVKCINMRWEQISVHKLGAYFESFAYFRIHRLVGFSNLMGPDKAIH